MKFVLVAVFLLCLPSYFAQAKSPCNDTEHTQFDFWLGQWQVKSQNNDKEQRSLSRIKRILNGCAILEEYTTPNGFEGKSLNIYDKTTDKWHQTWADNTGLLLKLEGNWNGKSMVLAGTGVGEKGETVLHKITWTPKINGSVRQVWTHSKDNGKSWQPLFDGLYTQETEHRF